MKQGTTVKTNLPGNIARSINSVRNLQRRFNRQRREERAKAEVSQ